MVQHGVLGCSLSFACLREGLVTGVLEAFDGIVIDLLGALILLDLGADGSNALSEAV